MTCYALIGAGGFAREVLPLARAQLDAWHGEEGYELFLVDRNADGTAKVQGHRLIHDDEFFRIQGPKGFNITVADSRIRERIALQALDRGCEPFHVKAASAESLAENEIGDGAIFCSHSMVTASARVGRYFHCNIYAYVAHDCMIGDFVTFAPRVSCNGNVVIEDHAYIGTGAVLKQGQPGKPLVIGRGAIVGMGAVVTRSVPPGETVVGNPARPMPR